MTAESNPAALAPGRSRSQPRSVGADVPSALHDPDRQRAWVEIDCDALLANARAVRDRSGVPLIPMVKADAYGVGAVAAARVLDALGPWGFGVASVAEGEELRRAGVSRRIVVFTPLLATEFSRAAASDLTPSLHRAEDVARWATASRGAPWHLAIDTGMNRAGVAWDEVAAIAPSLVAHPPEGAYTHFHSADVADDSRAVQERRFDDALAALPARPPIVHAENSPALERSGRSRWTVARPGIFLYGVGSGSGVEPAPVVHLRARVVDLRLVRPGESVSYGATWRAPADEPRQIATVAAGYADGYRRSLGNRGVALLRGKQVPVVGWVTMDMTMLDVTGLECEVGDVVTLLGRDGGATLDVARVARAAGLSPYEILVGLRLRAPRLYLGG